MRKTMGEAARGGPIAAGLLGLLAGPALQVQQAQLWGAAAYGALVMGGLALLLAALVKPYALRAVVRAATLCLACAGLSFAVCGLRSIAFLDRSLDPALEGRDVSLVGIVAAMPQAGEAGTRFRFDVESAHMGDGSAAQVPPRMWLGWYGGLFADAADSQRQPAPLRAGERWQFTARLKAPHGSANPHGFDYELWLWEQGVQATGYVRAGPRDPAPRRIGDTLAHPVERARQAVRDAVFERIADRKTAGILAALIVGDQNAIDRADWDVFRATGVAHLMSISGLHVTMFAWAAALAVGFAWRRSARACLALPAPTAALLGGLALAAAYALFSGWGVPSQRTIWMLTTVTVLRLGGGRWPWLPALLLAAAVVVTVDPWALLQPGFWLSFVAVGVLFATDSGARNPAAARSSAHPEVSKGEPEPGALSLSKGRFASQIRAAIREQWVVTLALTPLSLLLFNQVSLVGLAANLLAIPWVTLVVTPLAMLGVALPWLWDAAAWAVQALAGYLQWLAGLPFASHSVATAPLGVGIVGVAGGLLLAMPIAWRWRLPGLVAMLPLLLWHAPRPAAGEFELLAADIGQGNAVLVRTASHTLVYDTGPRFSRDSDAGNRVLVPLLRALGERVDTVVVSHRDADHSGGALAVLKMQPGAVLLSSVEADHELQEVRPVQRCVAGQRWEWDGIAFDVLHPQPADYEAKVKSNGLSCVLRISNGQRTALLAGDIEQAQEAALASSVRPEVPIALRYRREGDEGFDTSARTALRSDVLLVPHHGSKTSSSAAFLDSVQPSIAFVQAGYRNRFGHPAPSVIERYRERGIRVVDSPHCGAATWRSSAPGEVTCQRAVAMRYWHHRPP